MISITDSVNNYIFKTFQTKCSSQMYKHFYFNSKLLLKSSYLISFFYKLKVILILKLSVFLQTFSKNSKSLLNASKLLTLKSLFNKYN